MKMSLFNILLVANGRSVNIAFEIAACAMSCATQFTVNRMVLSATAMLLHNYANIAEALIALCFGSPTLE